MPHQLGRYTRMLLAALEEHAAVGVRNVLERDLGRPATRNELSAVRRAANHLSATGRAGVVHVQAPRLGTGPGSSYLALIRLGAEDVSAEQLAAAVSPVVLPPLRDDLATTARVVSIVARAAEVAPRIRAYQVPPESAGALAVSLGDSIAELTRLRRQLVRRGTQ